LDHVAEPDVSSCPKYATVSGCRGTFLRAKLRHYPLAGKLKEIGVALSDLRFAVFLCLLGIVFWLPFWCFFNICALYVDSNLDTARLYQEMRGVAGDFVAGWFSSVGKDGVRRILGETISHTGLVIMIFQVAVSRIFERRRALRSFFLGLGILGAGFLFLGYARIGAPAFIFLGILLFAVGEMIASPRIQEYIQWIAPEAKAGLYTGRNSLAVMLGGALSCVTYAALYGTFNDQGHPEYVWFPLAAHLLAGIALLVAFIRFAGEFQEQQQ